MLIEQIIEFESSLPGPLVEHMFPKLVIFIVQQTVTQILERII